MKKLLIAFLFLPAIVRSQQLPDTLTHKIDAVLSRWKNTQPGCAVSVVIGDHIVYSKGFGLANVENQIPVTPESVFTLASISKEFVGYAITLLVKERKIALDDDIRQYLPWLPAYPYKVSVADLLHHTSGLREHIVQVHFSGFPMNGIMTRELALNIIKKNKTLDFKPGEKYVYCNSNFVLLAEIIKKVTGKNLGSFADSVIFRPLNMHNSRFKADPYEIVKNYANSYSDDNGHVTTFPLIYHTDGDGGMLSSSDDLARWAVNFYNPKVGDLSAMQLYSTPGRLNNGKLTDYGLGVFTNIHRGQRRLMHKGGIAGYKNFIAVYPDLQIGIVILTNADNGPKTTATMEALAALLVPEGKLVDQITQEDLMPITVRDTLTVKRLAGAYVAHNGEKVHLSWKKDGLYADTTLLSPAKGNTWCAKNNPGVRYHFGHNAKNALQVEIPGPNPAVPYHLIKALPKGIAALKAYCGTYTTDELDYSFTISFKNGKLQLNNHRHGSTDITLYGADDLYPDFYFIDHLVAVRNKRGQLTGLELARGFTSGLIFRKEKNK